MSVAAALGYSSDERLLIVNADDYGLCDSVNKAVEQLLEERAVSSATIMMPCPAAREAARWSAQHQEHDVGVHFTFTSEWDNYRWGPVSKSEDVPSLLAEDGYFPKDSRTFELQADSEQVERELVAQIELALQLGMKPSHADNHMGSLYGLETGKHFLPIVFDVCAKYGLPFRLPRHLPGDRVQTASPELAEQAKQLGMLADSKGVIIPDYLVGLPFQLQAGETYVSFKEAMKQQLRSLKPGLTELIIHPSLVTDELFSFHGQPEKRGLEFQLFRDREIVQVLHGEGIRLVRWSELQRVQRERCGWGR
ncbi:polysaccharide deacetylase family protein [Paenibacillus sp. KS-LC4]|uniref:polysaccharide deacetylase family protein n=1 Tax=Paenibacillus sp. KS-LC4 TaxID=2979727 RepID=UPI0030D42131